MPNPTSKASRASDLDDDQGSNLRSICLSRLFATLTRFRPVTRDRHFSKKRHGFGWIWKKWKIKPRPKCFVFWSGRWESNPTPQVITRNLLILKRA